MRAFSNHSTNRVIAIYEVTESKQNAVMKTRTKSLLVMVLFVGITALNITASTADLISNRKSSPKQILLDTGGGGGEGSALPGVNWSFAETPNGKPFIFWTWSAKE